jgi:hypothetical protein
MPQIKTAISVSDTLLQEAESIAEEMNIPRSQVWAMALEQFAKRYRNRQLLEQINAAADALPTPDEPESVDFLRTHQRRILRRVEWK